MLVKGSYVLPAAVMPPLSVFGFLEGSTAIARGQADPVELRESTSTARWAEAMSGTAMCQLRNEAIVFSALRVAATTRSRNGRASKSESVFSSRLMVCPAFLRSE